MVVKKILGGLAILALASCGSKSFNENQNQIPTVNVMQPIVQNVIYSKTFPAYLTAELSADIVAKVNGTLQKVLYSPGDKVAKGQILFVIDPTIYQDNVQAAEAALQTAEANLKYAEGNYKMMLQAIKVDAVSEVNLLQAQTNVESGKASVENAKASLQTAKTNLEYCYVRAPFSGRITKNIIDPGNYVSGANSPVQLASLYKEDFMFANLAVSNAEYMQLFDRMSTSKVNWADSASIILPQLNNRVIRGKLNYTSPAVDVTTGTVTMQVKVNNAKEILKAGMYVKVSLPYMEVKDAILIPESSIKTTQQGSLVYVLGDSNTVMQQILSLGPQVRDSLVVAEKGITSNEYFVTSALLKVHNGSKVKPIMPKSQK